MTAAALLLAAVLASVDGAAPADAGADTSRAELDTAGAAPANLRPCVALAEAHGAVAVCRELELTLRDAIDLEAELGRERAGRARCERVLRTAREPAPAAVVTVPGSLPLGRIGGALVGGIAGAAAGGALAATEGRGWAAAGSALGALVGAAGGQALGALSD